jgi:ABC-2 type transport system permease protein
VSSPSETPSTPSAPDHFPAPPSGVIHDLGYRPYTGLRLGEGPVAWAFFVTGLRNTYGLGRSARSKALPMILLGLMLLPALILVGVLVQARDLLGLDQQIVAYSTYPITTQLLISVFVAAQAPALISRDLRFRTITLYLARPMQRSVYVLVRLASLAAGTFVLIGAPLLLMYVGGLLADLPAGRETTRFLGAFVGALLLAAILAGLSGLVAALTVRRGMAVAAVIVVLGVSYTVVASIQGIAFGTGHERVGEVAGIFSPYTLVNGVQRFLFDSPAATITPPTGTAMGLLYVAASLAFLLGSVGALVARYRNISP